MCLYNSLIFMWFNPVYLHGTKIAPLTQTRKLQHIHNCCQTTNTFMWKSNIYIALQSVEKRHCYISNQICDNLKTTGQVNTINMIRNKCCFCFDLRTGCVLVAAFRLITWLLIFIAGSYVCWHLFILRHRGMVHYKVMMNLDENGEKWSKITKFWTVNIVKSTLYKCY